MKTDDPYLSLSPRERLELLDVASRQSGLAPAILEKDYWVCKTLDALFALPELGSHFGKPNPKLGLIFLV
jgi:hypothetical protein